MDNAMYAAFVSFGLAAVVSFGVAGLIKLLVFIIQGLGSEKSN